MKQQKKKVRGGSTPLMDELLAQITPQEMARAEDARQLANRIAELLDEKNISNSELARRLDVHPSQITRWLSGSENIGQYALTDIRKAIGVEMAEFYAEPQGHKAEVAMQIFVKVEANTQQTRWSNTMGFWNPGAHPATINDKYDCYVSSMSSKDFTTDYHA